MKIGRHLSELWKKEKGVVFYETPCTCLLYTSDAADE